MEKLLKWGCEEQRVTLLTDFVSRDFAFLWNEASEEELREFAIKRCVCVCVCVCVSQSHLVSVSNATQLHRSDVPP